MTTKPMTRDEITELVIGVVDEVLRCGTEKVVLSASLTGDLGASSRYVTEVVTRLEEELLFELPDRLADGPTTVGDLVDYIDKVLNGVAA